MKTLMILLCRTFTNLYRITRSVIYPVILRGRSMQVYRELPGLVRLLEEEDIPYWLGGGIAYDAIRRYKTRPHQDIDFTILEEDLPRVKTLMESAGFRFQYCRRSFYRAIRGSVKVDFFAWRKMGDYRECLCDRSMARVHASLFEQFSTVRIGGQEVRLVATDVMHTFLPLVRYEQDQNFIKQQLITGGYQLVTDVQEVQLTLDCLRLEPIEFDGEPISETACLEQGARL